jgi:tRNA threonylcarbamoyladenosine biosynthesis protein TsaE
MHITYNLSQLSSIAKNTLEQIKLRKSLEHATVVCLHGDLGAGKTTLVSQLAKLLNIPPAIQSPTFVILKNYSLENNTFKNFIHIDAYRLQSESELEKLNWQTYVGNPDNLICIEWSENVPKCIPIEHIDIYLEHIDQETRTIEIK